MKSFVFSSVVALSAVFVGAPNTVAAQDSFAGLDLYVSGAVGASLQADYEGDLNTTLTNPTEGDFDTSGVFRLAVGSAFGSSFRGELEYSFRHMLFADDFNPSTGGPANSVGDAGISALMVNGLYAMPIGSSGFVGYAGGGLGVAHVDVDFRRGPPNTGFVMSQGDYTSLAAQLRVGGEYELSNGMAVFADYTYFHVAQEDFDGFNTFSGAQQQSFGPINSHEIAVGLRFSF